MASLAWTTTESCFLLLVSYCGNYITNELLRLYTRKVCCSRLNLRLLAAPRNAASFPGGGKACIFVLKSLPFSGQIIEKKKK